jgi:cytochrome c-type biogenesis protein CcmH/NrfF
MTRHPLDLFSLLGGLLSIAGAAVWLLLDQGHVDVDHLFWAAPLTLVVVGATAVAASLRQRR